MSWPFPRWLSWQKALTLFYWLGLLVIAKQLALHEDSVIKALYLAYPAEMLLALYAKSPVLKAWACVVASSVLVVLGVVAPLETELIEESFILAPLLVLILYPGRVWPVVFAVLLLLPYFAGNEESLDDLLEDCIELLVITTFATIMTYYQRKFYAQMLAFQSDSLTDYLTRLPNRLAFSQHIGQTQYRALLLIDMDDFKRVNDLYGHRYGDLLLRQFAERLERVAGNKHAFRLGGDEFAVLLVGEDEETVWCCAESVAERLLQVNREPYHLLNRALSVSLSMGIAVAHPDDDSEQLSRQADLALYHAKEKGKNTFARYEQALSEKREQRDYIEQQLSTALENDEFYLVFQPKVALDTGRIVGAEALLRWQHPQLGEVPPMRFIPLAEGSRQIIPIGRWVLREACWQGREWSRLGLMPRLAVNISAVQLEYDDVLTMLDDVLEETGADPALLELEITETSMAESPERVLPVLEGIRARKVQLALDDFGVAYSSLNQLSQLPIDVLKIDKSFVDRCVDSDQDHMILRSILQLAENLHLRVIAEGVETTEQQQRLMKEGCKLAQGYLFYRPLSSEALTQLLLAQRDKG